MSPGEPLARWAGIDEAGYGPNLGPLVMAAVVAEGPADRPPDVWADLPSAVCRADGPADRLHIDDSKAILRGGKGRDRLDAGVLALLAAVGLPTPRTVGELLGCLEAGALEDAELDRWIETDPTWPPRTTVRAPGSPFADAPWRIVAVRVRVVGPARFNAGLTRTDSKAAVHFATFAELLHTLWSDTTDAVPLRVRSDKHGGRHYYLGPLTEAFPDLWIDRGLETPDKSAYALRQGARRLDLELTPRADAESGLVALASMTAKAVREAWMDAFNAYWLTRFPDLKPTAGYPVDAARFAVRIEPDCAVLGWSRDLWWRAR